MCCEVCSLSMRTPYLSHSSREATYLGTCVNGLERAVWRQLFQSLIYVIGRAKEVCGESRPDHNSRLAAYRFQIDPTAHIRVDPGSQLKVPACGS